MVNKRKKAEEFIDFNPLDTMVPDNYFEEEISEERQTMTPEDFKRLTDLGIGDIKSMNAPDEEIEIEHVDRVIEEDIPDDEYIVLDTYGTIDRVDNHNDDEDDDDDIELPSLKKPKEDEVPKEKEAEENKDNTYDEDIDINSDEVNELKEIDIDILQDEDLKEDIANDVVNELKEIKIDEIKDVSLDDEDIDELDLDVDLDETLVNFLPISSEPISLATGHVNEEESKELEDFLFDDIASNNNLIDGKVDINKLVAEELEIEENLLEQEEIDEYKNEKIVLTTIDDIDFEDDLEENIESSDEEEDTSSEVPKNDDISDVPLEEILFDEEEAPINTEDVVTVSEEELAAIRNSNEIISSVNISDEFFEEEEKKDTITSSNDLELEKSLENLKEKIDEVYEEESHEQEDKEIKEEVKEKIETPNDNEPEGEPIVSSIKQVQRPKQVVITTKVPVSKEVPNKEPKIITNLEMTLDKHMEENAKEMKGLSTWQKVLGVVGIVSIIVVAIVVIVAIYDKDLFARKNGTTTTTMPNVVTKEQSTTTTSKNVVTVERSTTTTQPVHEKPNLPSTTTKRTTTTTTQNTTTRRSKSPFTTTTTSRTKPNS